MQYHKRRVYYRELYHKLEHLDHKYLLAEMLDKPEFSDGAVLYDVLHQVSKSMNDTLADYRRKNTDYREYIETWVHEIKTPIASSRLMLENNKGPLSRTLGAELSKIENYVEQALFYTRSSSVEKDYIIKRVDLKELVSGVVKKNAMPLIEAKVSVELCELEQEVFTDSKWLDFILGQLISNAVKYRSDQPKLKISAEPRSQSVLLRLSDNGIGIPEQDINRVFEKGFTGENGRKYNRSTGIGLYLCKKIVRSAGVDDLHFFPVRCGHRCVYSFSKK